MTLDVRAGHTIIWVKEVLPNDLLLLEGKDGRECCEHSKNYAQYHYSLRIQFILNWPSCQRVFYILCVEKRNERLLCSCVISVNVVGTWHA